MKLYLITYSPEGVKAFTMTAEEMCKELKNLNVKIL